MTDQDLPRPPTDLGQPHDGLFKLVLGRPEHAASELRSILPDALVERLDLDRLEKVDGSFVDPALRQHHTDVLFRTTLDQREALVYVLIEHQTRPDWWMALRMLSYLTRIWERHLVRDPTITRLPLIIPVVIYQGRQRWRAPTEFADLLDLGDSATPLVPRFSYLLDDLMRLSPQQLRDRKLTPPALLMIVLLTRAPGSEHLPHQLDAWFDQLRLLMEEADWPNLLRAFYAYAVNVSNTPESELTDYIARLGPHAKEIAVTTADLLRAGERADMLIEQLRAKFGPVTPSTETAVRSASPAQLKTWTARIITATTLEEFLG